MVDVVTAEQRSRMMAGIRGKNTKPEIIVRTGLFKRGFRYRLNDKRLPGKPDLVFPKYGAVIFINGCFWHKHNCHLFKWPKTNSEFWKKKLTANAERDRKNVALLRESGWRVSTVWECALKGKSAEEVSKEIENLSIWLQGET